MTRSNLLIEDQFWSSWLTASFPKIHHFRLNLHYISFATYWFRAWSPNLRTTRPTPKSRDSRALVTEHWSSEPPHQPVLLPVRSESARGAVIEWLQVRTLRQSGRAWVAFYIHSLKLKPIFARFDVECLQCNLVLNMRSKWASMKISDEFG